MIDHFDSERYLDVVLGTKQCPPLTEPEPYEKWKGNDARARAILKAACSDELRSHIEKIGTSAEMWKILEGYANTASSVKGRERLLNYFERLKPQPGGSISKFLGEITSIKDQLKGTDQDISDRTFRNKILKNLPNLPQYAMVKTLLDHEKTPSTTQEIIEMLKDTEIELEELVTSQNTAATSESALYTNTNMTNLGDRGPGSFRGRGQFRGRGSFRGGSGVPIRRFDYRNSPYPAGGDPTACYVCGKRGHRASDCYHNRKTCFSCGETTHTSQDCKYTTLTQEQAKKGRGAFATWTIQKNSKLEATTATANSTVTETIESGLYLTVKPNYL